MNPTDYSDEIRHLLDEIGTDKLILASPRFLGEARSPMGVICGLWLRAGNWNRAHEVAQDLHTVEGSFWHGIIHRQEPDPGNASYWFRRTGPHPVFPALREAVKQLVTEHPAVRFPMGRDWDPYNWIRFYDAARLRTDSAEWAFAREVERVEWEVLFDYCARNPNEPSQSRRPH